MVRRRSWQQTARLIQSDKPAGGGVIVISPSGLVWLFSGATELDRALVDLHVEEDHTLKEMLVAHLFIQKLQDTVKWHEAPIPEVPQRTRSHNAGPCVARTNSRPSQDRAIRFYSSQNARTKCEHSSLEDFGRRSKCEKNASSLIQKLQDFQLWAQGRSQIIPAWSQHCKP